MKKFIKQFGLAILFTLLTVSCFASSGGINSSEYDMVECLANLILQLSIILFVARIGGTLFEKMKLPGVLGEIISGVIIGPYCLGKFAFPGFAQGLFPVGLHFPVSVELYSIATIASIILLFLVGLETDFGTFMRYSLAGSVIGIGGVLISFILGDYAVVLFSQYFLGQSYAFTDPVPLFMGVISTATSVGITARILSQKRKMNEPEGVTILAGAVIDDVLGIIILAVTLGIIKSGHVEFVSIAKVAFKAVAIWLGFTAFGLIFSNHISKFLKQFKNRSTIALMAFALAMLLAGIFEKSGLAMIIGAYTMGLSLSKTDLSFMIQDNLSVLYQFFVPIFFCVMGMLVDLHSLTHWNILAFGIIFTVVAVLGKLLGCSVPALFLNFNFNGALRVGLGMIPRGEVALIMAGIGLSAGILNTETFSIAIIMTFLTTLITPPLLAKVLAEDKPVLRKEVEVSSETVDIVYDLPNAETAQLIRHRIVTDFEEEGFYVHFMHHGGRRVYQIRKGQSFITLEYASLKLIFTCEKKDKAFVQTLFYEVLAEIESVMKHLQALTDKENIGKQIFSDADNTEAEKEHKDFLHSIFSAQTVTISLKNKEKQGIIEELLDLLVQSGKLEFDKKDEILKDLMEREGTMTTGMQDGVALPHTKTKGTNKLISAIGLVKDGVDFDALDGKLSKIFVMTIAPKGTHEPYLEYLAEISKLLMDAQNRERILATRTNAELYKLFVELI